MSGLPKLSKNRDGQTNTNDEAHEAVIQIRIQAAKGMERPPQSDGNVESNEEGPTPVPDRKMRVPAPAKSRPDHNDPGREATPPFAKESLAGDGWTRARENAKSFLRNR